MKPSSSENKATRSFAGTAIMERIEFVSKHFQQYPVLYIDLKDIHGLTYEGMLRSFDRMVLKLIESLSTPYSDLRDDNFCTKLRTREDLQLRRDRALLTISQELRRVYMKHVVLLIDEYDAPMHAAMEHGYAAQVRSFILLYSSARMRQTSPSLHSSFKSNQQTSSTHMEFPSLL